MPEIKKPEYSFVIQNEASETITVRSHPSGRYEFKVYERDVHLCSSMMMNRSQIRDFAAKLMTLIDQE